MGWIVEFLVQTIWEGCAELARKIGGKGCFWAVILVPGLIFLAVLAQAWFAQRP